MFRAQDAAEQSDIYFFQNNLDNMINWHLFHFNQLDKHD